MGLSDLKRRIKTVKNTGKITKAMSLISAAHLSKAKNVLSAYESYTESIAKIIYSIAYGARNRFDENIDSITISNELIVKASQHFLEMEEHYIVSKRKLLIVVTAEKGLCGAFNSSIVHRVAKEVNHETDIFCIGKKGYEMLFKSRKQKFNIIDNKYIELNFKKVKSNIVMNAITMKILKLIASNQYCEVNIIYTEFVSMLNQKVDMKQLLPINLSKQNNEAIAFDRNPNHMLNDIIPQYLHSILYDSILHSLKSESAKRMMTMDNASKTSKEMQEKLTLKYNRARQTKVTMELIEIISGMTAL